MVTIRVKSIESINNTHGLISRSGRRYLFENDIQSDRKTLGLSLMCDYTGMILERYRKEYEEGWWSYNDGYTYIWHKHVEEVIDGKE